MATQWLSLADIPVHGREFSFTDQSIWTAPLDEFGFGYRITHPFRASLQVLPQKKGFLLQGRIQGGLTLPCDRCAEPGQVEVDESFQVYEELPEEKDEKEEELLHRTGEHYELNVSALIWEQFLLALPTKILCTPQCRGICPVCGRNLNIDPCECEREKGDSRLSVLRNLKINHH
ncbi:MAG: YceD family protein [Desulfovibrionales bacterium]